MFTLAMPAAPFSLTSWAISTFCKAGFFLTGVAVLSGLLGDEGGRAVHNFCFLLDGEERLAEVKELDEEKDGLVVERVLVEGLAMTKPEKRLAAGFSKLVGTVSPLALAWIV